MCELEFKTALSNKNPGFRKNAGGVLCFPPSFCNLLPFLKVMNHLAMLFAMEDYHFFPCEC